MTTVPLKRAVVEIDVRAGTLRPPLLAVSIHRGVVPRSEMTHDLSRAEDLTNYKLCEADDLVLNRMRAFQGAIGVSPTAGLVSPDYLVLRSRSNADARYLHHAFRSSWFIGEMTSRIRGIGSVELGSVRTPRINAEDLLAIEMPLPGADTQRRIADFLDDQVARIDNIIAARARQQELQHQALTAEIRRIVAGDFHGDSNRIASALWIARLGPEAKEVALSRIVTLQRGVDLTAEQQRPGEFPVVTTAGAVGSHDVAVVQQAGVVIGRYGSVGNVHWIDVPHWPHNTTLYVRDYHGNVPRYCYYLLRSYPYEMLQARAAVPGVNRNDMAPDLMPWIPVEQQFRAAKQLDEQSADTLRRVAQLQRSEDLLIELKRSLITAAVSGEFDVSSADGSQVPVG